MREYFPTMREHFPTMREGFPAMREVGSTAENSGKLAKIAILAVRAMTAGQKETVSGTGIADCQSAFSIPPLNGFFPVFRLEWMMGERARHGRSFQRPRWKHGWPSARCSTRKL
jgi:hypothetical protein